MILKTKWVKLFQRKKWKKTSLRKYKLFFSLLKNIRFVSMLFVCCFNSIVFLLNSKCNVPQHSFLNGRTQRMKVGLKISNKISLTSGVPQGGVLSPLVFVLYVSGYCFLLQLFFCGAAVEELFYCGACLLGP